MGYHEGGRLNGVEEPEGLNMDYNEVVNDTFEILIKDDREQGSSRKRVENIGLKIILGILLITIAGLSVKVGINNVKHNGVEIDNDHNLPGIVVATKLTEDISKELIANKNYDREHALTDYLYAYNTTDGDAKVFIALEYANFAFGENNAKEGLHFLLNEEKGLKFGTYSGFNFYAEIGSLYKRTGNIELANYYYNKAAEGDYEVDIE